MSIWPRSGSGKFIVACVLIPFLWPYVPFILLFMAVETLRMAYISRKYRKVKLRKVTHGQKGPKGNNHQDLPVLRG